jgi:hypothetical protein
VDHVLNVERRGASNLQSVGFQTQHRLRGAIMHKYMAIVLALGVVAASACSTDALGPGNASSEDRAQIEDLLSDLSFFNDGYGDDGLPTLSVAANFDGDVAADAPQNWGRHYGVPVERDIQINVENGVATVTKKLVFEGSFMIRDQGSESVVQKTMNETRVQTAVLQRLEQDEVNPESGRRHRWKLLEISPAEHYLTDETAQTVNIDSVEVLVNEQIVLTVRDPAELINVENRLTRLEKGSVVTVRAYVQNDDTVDGSADTFVYLHLRCATPEVRVWGRRAMEFNQDLGAYVASWTVYHRGRERIIVDAIDAKTFNPDDLDNYDANIWAIPYRTILLTDNAGTS